MTESVKSAENGSRLINDASTDHKQAFDSVDTTPRVPRANVLDRFSAFFFRVHLLFLANLGK